MDVTRLRVPMDCFPRWSFASRNTPGIEARFNRMMKQAGMTDEKVFHCCKNDTVFISIYRNMDEKDTFITEKIVRRNSSKIIKLLNGFHQKEKDCLEIAILTTMEKEDILKLGLNTSKRFVIDAQEVKNDPNSEEVVTTAESLASDIDDYLEHEAYKPLMKYYKILQNLLHCSIDENVEDKGMTFKFENPKAIPREAIEQLLEEIMALLNSSHIQEEQKPHPECCTTPMSEQVRKELFEMCPTIMAVGYRFQKIHLYLEEIKDKNEMGNRKQTIEKFMEKNLIGNYSSSIVYSEMKELMSAGSKVIARNENQNIKKSGSLGCIAEMEAGDSRTDCILVAKHVVLGCSDLFLEENVSERRIASVIESTSKYKYGSLDIAAAEAVVKIENDDRKLKDSVGNLRRGKLIENIEGRHATMSGIKVHVWGSKSQPGKGIITDTNYTIEGMNASLVQIQNEESYPGAEVRPFAVEGDSGGIICSDDPDDEHVNAYAMLIGKNLETTYIALPLDKGIIQLEEQTGNTFTLFN
ncbi:uncharacterized protein LOC132735874 [Ruditapes philippinarum]|uniref:uncharacterized protein LOC132735874 n=1 Tax=Ruditapes philippinarum TaxID=129788 RepID=UPI00295AB16E|nr:uncharacterized protein LOC132735874 [Ruditapes philippinarum]